MKTPAFEKLWMEKVNRVRASSFYRQVSSPPETPIIRANASAGDVEITSAWSIRCEGPVAQNGMTGIAIADMQRFIAACFGVTLRDDGAGQGELVFALKTGKTPSRWDASFDLRVSPGRIAISAVSERALLRASIFLSNYMSLRRFPGVPSGFRRIRPSVPLHIGADLWGGFCTTQAWIPGRETDDNFLELARMGIDGVPIMTLLEEYIDRDSTGCFGSLIHPDAGRNRQRLASLGRRAATAGAHIFLMGYNPKLPPDHRVFIDYPSCAGATQSGGAFRTLCSSDPLTRRFLVESWASLFEDIPELGGVIAITGGEGFYHCFMRNYAGASDCVRCGTRSGSETVAELVNDVARGIHAVQPEARLITWPYSAGHWSMDRDQKEFIDRLDTEHVVFQTEVDKDSVDWRQAGYAKNIWDYSMSRVTVSDRCRVQRRQCASRRQPFSVKLEINNSIECLSVPYIPALENQRRIWENARRLRPYAIHSRWLFDGACKSPSEELGYWSIWGRGTAFADLSHTLDAIAARDFGEKAGRAVRRAWALFSEALRHHPQLDYYIGSYFVGPGQPLILDPERVCPGENLDPSFFGQFYWHWEVSATDDDTAFVHAKPLFYARPGFRAIARRGPRRGEDVALDELKTMAGLWERGVRELDRARTLVPPVCRPRFEQEYILGKYMALTWRSAARVEEFLRRRDTIREFSGSFWLRSGHRRENRRDLNRMEKIARQERALTEEALGLARRTDFLDLSLRLDMGTATAVGILTARLAQIDRLLSVEMPQWRKRALS